MTVGQTTQTRLAVDDMAMPGYGEGQRGDRHDPGRHHRGEHIG